MAKNKYQDEVIAPGDKASKLAKNVCVASYENNLAVNIIPRQPGNFRGAVDYVWQEHVLQMMRKGAMSETIQNDGAGGKLQFSTFIGTDEVFGRTGWEPIVMVIDDIARAGGYPVIFSNDINTKTVTEENFHLVESTLNGFGEILKASSQINITGEFAIMKHSITAFCDINDPNQYIMNWAGTGIGLTHKDKVIDGSGIKKDMPIVYFWEPGYRCNGGTFFTNLILAIWGREGLKKLLDNQEARNFVKKLTTPSVSYAKIIRRGHGWKDDGTIVDPYIKMAGIAHITGGGIEKFIEILPSGIGTDFYNMPKPAEVLLEAQELSWNIDGLRLTDQQAHTTLHGGCGMMVVCETDDDAEKLIDEAYAYGVEAGVCGVTTKSEESSVVINSQFKEGVTLVY